MEPEEISTSTEQGDKFENLKKVTPLSKYLAMALFVALPFIGGWIGYQYAPEKVVEVEKFIEVEKVVEVEKVDTESTFVDTEIRENLEKNKGKILPDLFFSSETNIVISQLANDLSIGDEKHSIDATYVKYYDDNIVILYILTTKACAFFEMYYRLSKQEAENAFGKCGFLLEDHSHLVMVTDEGILTWKIGDSTTNLIPNSALDLSSGESYEAPLGQMGYLPEATYENGVLTVNIFRDEGRLDDYRSFVQTKTYIIE